MLAHTLVVMALAAAEPAVSVPSSQIPARTASGSTGAKGVTSQNMAPTWSELANQLHPDEELAITDRLGGHIEGVLAEVRSDALLIRTRSEARRIVRGDVESVITYESDSPLDGLLLGAGLGLGIGVLATQGCGEGDICPLAMLAIDSLVGGALGFWLDWRHRATRTVYQASVATSSPTSNLRLAPVVAPSFSGGIAALSF